MSKWIPPVVVALLSILFVSCGATRHVAPASAEELARLVLFIRELPDGTVAHSWQRAEEIDLAQYRRMARPHGGTRRIVLAMSRQRDCDEENRDCIDKCMDRTLPPGYEHIVSSGKLGAKLKYCTEQCQQPYRDCAEVERLRPQEFTAIDTAIDWLKRNRKTILVGGVITIAGVAFVVISAGAGIVVLAPLVLVAAPGTEGEPFMAKVPR